MNRRDQKELNEILSAILNLLRKLESDNSLKQEQNKRYQRRADRIGYGILVFTIIGVFFPYMIGEKNLWGSESTRQPFLNEKKVTESKIDSTYNKCDSSLKESNRSLTYVDDNGDVLSYTSPKNKKDSGKGYSIQWVVSDTDKQKGIVTVNTYKFSKSAALLPIGDSSIYSASKKPATASNNVSTADVVENGNPFGKGIGAASFSSDDNKGYYIQLKGEDEKHYVDKAHPYIVYAKAGVLRYYKTLGKADNSVMECSVRIKEGVQIRAADVLTSFWKIPDSTSKDRKDTLSKSN